MYGGKLFNIKQYTKINTSASTSNSRETYKPNSKFMTDDVCFKSLFS